uniref:Metalloendopeptidase n=1 Tax=Setaria digitata TaxID=48799 RepID=A0A915PPN1_9BILA
MKQIIIFAQLSVCFILYSGESYRTQRASRHTLQQIKQLITLSTQRQIESTNHGMLFDELVLQKRDPEVKRHHNELSVNDLDDYFQGDVDLSEKQAELLSEHFKSEIASNEKGDEIIRNRRSVGREPFYVRWHDKQPISYDFAESIPQETRQKIRAAIRMWEERTCIRFLENGPNVDRIEFFDGGGCSSFVGRTGGTQGISISTPGCDIVGIISHEIGHTLGIFHEQARLDQNNHISINYNNIPFSRWNNFFPLSNYEADTFNLPYDAGSVMHYGPYGFAADPHFPTITTRDRFQQYTIGQREGPSFLDYASVKLYLKTVLVKLSINIAYRCMEQCPPIQCDHNGYPNPNNCSKCLCPDGFAGPTCQFVQYTPCGALIKMKILVKLKIRVEDLYLSVISDDKYFDNIFKSFEFPPNDPKICLLLRFPVPRAFRWLFL